MNDPAALAISRVGSPFHARLHVPGSKSETNRALLVAGLASGTTRLNNVLFSDDTEHMINALNSMGIDIRVNDDQVIVEGKSGVLRHPEKALFLGNSGTCMRFLASVVALGEGEFVLDGNDRMRQRPLQDLIDGLSQLDVDITAINGNGCPPVRVRGGGLAGGTVRMRGSASSQYVSSILMAAPLARGPVTITIDGPLVSRPYVTMTTRVMERFGARVSWQGDDAITVQPGAYMATPEYTIESDYSSASYFMAAAALTGSTIELTSLPEESMQGDAAFLEVLRAMGARARNQGDTVIVEGTGRLDAVTVDMFNCSDLLPTVAVMAAFARGTTCISNVENARIKETDRITAVATELKRMGVNVTEHRDGLTIEGLPDPGQVKEASIDTYDDHRMAMAFSIAGLVTGRIRIKDPGCVKKTYPGFFDELSRLVPAGGP